MEIIIPNDDRVSIESVKFNITCKKCGNTWAKTVWVEDGVVELKKGWNVCTPCAELALDEIAKSLE